MRINTIKNPNITGMLSVTKVKITPDFKYAKVYVSVLNSKNIEKTMQGLKESAGYIRSQIAKTINLRITPELNFELDDSLEYGMKIENTSVYSEIRFEVIVVPGVSVQVCKGKLVDVVAGMEADGNAAVLVGNGKYCAKR